MAPVALQRFRIVCLRAQDYEGPYDLGPLRIGCDQASKFWSNSISMKFTDDNRAVLQKGISGTPINFRISALVPVGLIVESVVQLDNSILVTARTGIQVASCPLCGSPSRLSTRQVPR